MTLLAEYFGKKAKVRLAETALCVDVTFPCAVSAQELARNAMKAVLRVIPTVGGEENEKNACVRLSFAGIAEEDMRGGVALLHQIAEENR